MVTWKLCIKKISITQTISRKSVSCDIVVRKLCKYVYTFEFINARIFSCQFFKYLQISSALKKYKHSPAHFVRSQPEIIHLTPGATRTLVFISFHGKKGQISSSTVLNFIFGLKDTVHTPLFRNKRYMLDEIDYKKVSKVSIFFWNTKTQLGFFVFHFKQIWNFFF